MSDWIQLGPKRTAIKRKPKRKKIKKFWHTKTEVPAVKVKKDGREVCTDTPAGDAEYERRKDVMYENQKGICSLVPHWMPREEATFEHTDLRSGGRRNDAIEYTKPNGDKIVNTVACGYHNGQKGSKRTMGAE